MPSWCTHSTLYKGIFTLVVALILLEYLFGTIDNKIWDARINYNSTRLPRVSKEAQLTQNSIQRLLNFSNNTVAKVQNITLSTVNASLEQKTNINHSISTFINGLFDLNATPAESETPESNKLNATLYLPPCPDDPPDLLGRVLVVKHSVPQVYELEKRFSWLKPGGHWLPEHCKVDKKVAIVIPFRCRGEHLLIFLQHIHPFLKRQQLDYTIFIIEQDGTGPFNRAMLMNIGFKEALKVRNFDCFIFHDVDLLPEDDRNLYTCPMQPRHMSVAIDVFRYKLPYRTIFGGVSAITKEHFQLLNGFSNSFWGWGGEDDDMSNRISYHNLHISRYPLTIARYTMLSHKKDKPSPNRYNILKAGQRKFDIDGLNTLEYVVKQFKEHLLYTWILVSIEPPPS